MIDLIDLVRSIAAEAARAEENTNYPSPCTPGSPLLASVRQACVERGFAASGVAVSGATAATSQVTVGNRALSRAIDCLEILNKRPRPMCRDCADECGICPHDSLDCDIQKLIADARAALAAPPVQAAITLDQIMDEAAKHKRALVPFHVTRAMQEIMDNEGWQWEDVLGAAAAITDQQYAEIQAGAGGPMQPVAVPDGWRLVQAEQVDALNSAVQRAASELPDGYTITVEVERGYGGVSWRNPDGEQCDEYHSDILAEDVIDALADAKQDAAIATGALPSIESEAA